MSAAENARTEDRARIDNFDRHLWMVVGLAIGTGGAALRGWWFDLDLLLGFGLVGLVFYALITGRIQVRRRRD